MHGCTRLEVSLAAVAANYHLLRSRVPSGMCAAVVKADAYGLGMSRVAPHLANAGCQFFFVATLAEALQLRALLPEIDIGVFHGLASPQDIALYTQHRLYPALNTLGQCQWWHAHAGNAPCIIQVDTGMNRLGIAYDAVQHIPALPIRLVMSHYACASDAEHPLNALQQQRFAEVMHYFASHTLCDDGSLSNSAGLFLSPESQQALGRPGCALYGINPLDNAPNPMQAVARWVLAVLQVRRVHESGCVGYGALAPVQAGTKIAVLGCGYADGLPRIASHRLKIYWGEDACPIIGRVSMDSICVDVSHLSDGALQQMEPELIGAHQSVDALAATCQTIGYEIFTKIGTRVARVYV